MGSIPLKKQKSLCGPNQTAHPGAKNLSAGASVVNLKHPRAWRKKTLSVSETPSGIQNVCPPEIFLDEIRAAANHSLLITQAMFMTFEPHFRQTLNENRKSDTKEKKAVLS